jgi:hypothetical protein
MTAAPSGHVAHFAGTAREVGVAAGRALGPRLDANIARYLRERPQSPDALDWAELRRGALPWLRTLPDRFQDELEGLAEGACVPLQAVAEWNYVEQCVDDGCSAVVGWIDGHAWVARNNDMFVPGIWGHATIREIKGRIPTLTFGQEGDVFTATGVNRERLWLHHHALATSDGARPGRPHMSGWVLLTEMLETCSTIAQVERRLAEVDRDEGMLLVAIEGASDEVAVLECGRSTHARRPQDGAWLIVTNHATVLDEPPTADSRSRHARMESLADELSRQPLGPRPPGDLIAMLADGEIERRGADFSTVYATVACPAGGSVWFTFGGCPAASLGDWQPVAWPW